MQSYPLQFQPGERREVIVGDTGYIHISPDRARVDHGWVLRGADGELSYEPDPLGVSHVLDTPLDQEAAQ